MEASVGPSSRVKIWVWMMSGWRVEIESPVMKSTDAILGEQKEKFLLFVKKKL